MLFRYRYMLFSQCQKNLAFYIPGLHDVASPQCMILTFNIWTVVHVVVDCSTVHHVFGDCNIWTVLHVVGDFSPCFWRFYYANCSPCFWGLFYCSTCMFLEILTFELHVVDVLFKSNISNLGHPEVATCGDSKKVSRTCHANNFIRLSSFFTRFNDDVY